MAKQWSYSRAGRSIIGDMICCSCHARIENGLEFRSCSTKDGFQVQHRKCSSDDKGWTLHDRQNQLQLQLAENKLSAFKNFSAMWDVSQLDDEIALLEHDVERLKNL